MEGNHLSGSTGLPPPFQSANLAEFWSTGRGLGLEVRPNLKDSGAIGINENRGGLPLGHGANRFASSHRPISALINSRHVSLQNEAYPR